MESSDLRSCRLSQPARRRYDPVPGLGNPQPSLCPRNDRHSTRLPRRLATLRDARHSSPSDGCISPRLPRETRSGRPALSGGRGYGGKQSSLFCLARQSWPHGALGTDALESVGTTDLRGVLGRRAWLRRAEVFPLAWECVVDRPAVPATVPTS